MIEVCVLRTCGTNCDIETARAFSQLGAQVSIIHFNRFLKGRARLGDFQILVIPGGFSYGDHVRAGAIWASMIYSKLMRDLEDFLESDKLILGICNGFQVLVELGLLPGFHGIDQPPKASLAPNSSGKFECRWVYLRHENHGNCKFTKGIPRGKILWMPVAHSQGRFLVGSEDRKFLEMLTKRDQLVFRYCHPNGDPAKGEYPANPNGSWEDIAGICNPRGNVLGMMPHPERAFHGWQLPDWSSSPREFGDGKLIFQSAIQHLLGMDW